MDAHLAADLDVLDELYGAMLDLLRGLDSAGLNWRPPARGTNSIAALVHHTVGSSESWLARALDEPRPRDRDAEFRAAGTVAGAIALVEGARQRVRDQFARLATVDAAALRHARRLDRPAEQALSVAWCVEHALIHAGEHWGQIQLTRDLYAAHRAGGDGTG